MNLNADFSIYTEGQAFGLAKGEFEFDEMPSAGDTVDVLKGQKLPRDLPGFTGNLKVSAVGMFEKVDGSLGTTVLFEDVSLSSLADAKLLADFLENGLGLFVIEYKAYM